MTDELRDHPGRSLANPHTVSVVFTFTLNDTLPPLGVIADLIRNLLNRQRAKPSSSLRVIANKVSDTLGVAPTSLRA